MAMGGILWCVLVLFLLCGQVDGKSVVSEALNLAMPSRHPSEQEQTGCYFEGKRFKHNSVIVRKYDKVKELCTERYCDDSGRIVTKEVKCGQQMTTRKPKRSTTPERLIIEIGCFHNGKWYSPGSELSQGESGNWCYGSFCDHNGNIIQWDNFNCHSTVRQPTTYPKQPSTYPKQPSTYPKQPSTYPKQPSTYPEQPSTYPKQPSTYPEQPTTYTKHPTTYTKHPTTYTKHPTRFPFIVTTPFGCYSNGKWYAPRSEISTGRSGNWCYGEFCDESGAIVSWDNWNCFETTPIPPETPTPTMPPTTMPPTTMPPTTMPPTTMPGCYHEGKWYPYDGDISRGQSGNWCYGLYCDSHGMLIHWDNFNCFRTKTEPPTTPLTEPSTTLPTELPTTPPTEPPPPKPITKAETEPTTKAETEPPTKPSTKPPTTEHVTTPVGCYSNGKWYRPNSEVSRGRSGNWCYGQFCDDQGNLVPWDDFACMTHQPTTAEPFTTPLTQDRKRGCYFEGEWYKRNSDVSTGRSGDWCYGTYCDARGMLVKWDDFNCGSKSTQSPKIHH